MTVLADLYGPTRLPNAKLAEGMIPVFVYAVKSDRDDKDAISTQLKRCFAGIACEGGRQLMAKPFTEDNASGFKAERGDELDAVIAAATKAADEYGQAELWVWHSSRLGRGDGTKGRRSLTTIVSALRYHGVTPRSVLDEDAFASESDTASASKQNHLYSRNLSMWVRDGKERQREAGRYLGGSCPDGYAQDTRGDGTKGPRRLDEKRVPTLQRMFELGKSLGDSAVARKLNKEGHCRKSGKLWDPVAVHSILVNPHYAGRYTQKDGSQVPAIVSNADFDAVQVLRPGGPRSERTSTKREAQDKLRDAQGKLPRKERPMPKGGRSTDRYILAKLGKCARCGGSMYGRTSRFKRQDGTYDQNYMCANSPAYRSVTATCDAPRVNVQAVDSALIPHLRGFFVDFEKWLAQVTTAQDSERVGVASQLEDSRERLAKLVTAAENGHERYVKALADPETDPAVTATQEAALAKINSDRAQIEANISELEATLAELSKGAPTDAMLDHWNSVSASIRGAIDSANGDIGEINARLRQVLDRVEVDTVNGQIKLLAVFSQQSGRGEWVPKVDQDYEPLFDRPPDFFPDQVDIFASPKLAPAAAPFTATVPERGDLPKRSGTLTTADSVEFRGRWRLHARRRTSARSTRATTTSRPRATTPSGGSTSASRARRRC